jgi:hypothetical protein
MAARAVAAKGVGVGRVAQVAAATGRRQLTRLFAAIAMAGVAMELAMRTAQCERGLPIVVEAPAVPGVRVVTGFAAGPEAPFVEVGAAVAIHAAAWLARESMGQVAILARQELVEAQEGEAGQIVIEANRLPPRHLAVATLAGSTQAALVGVDTAVAGVTSGGSPIHADDTHVTCRTGDL